MFFSLLRCKFWSLVALTLGLICITSPLVAQTSSSLTDTSAKTTFGEVKKLSDFFPFLSNLYTFTGMPTAEWIWLDGRRLFQVTALKDNLPERVQKIENNLHQISNAYVQSNSNEVQVNVINVNGSPTIEINGQYLLSVTKLDAQLRGINTFTWAKQLSRILRQALVRAKQERQPQFLKRQATIACSMMFAIVTGNWILIRIRRRLQLTKAEAENLQSIATNKTSSNMRLRMLENQLLLYVQILLWLVGILVCLYLFPYTRPIQVWLLNVSKIPLIIGLILLGIYICIRLSNNFIERFASSISRDPFLSAVVSERVQLRITTIFRTIQWIMIIGWLIVGLIVALIVFGVDYAPLLAGAGLLGVAVSLASQNLLKDTINGFLIVLEDQYGIGDFIDTGTWSGMVEGLNLRITQLRNSEGKLITIPNSQIGAVANLTKSWSRVDLNVPVDYDTDTLAAIKIIETTAVEMSQDPQWQWQIVETPQIMGIDDFSERGVLVKIWIKTRPMRQWCVAREYRLRLKLAFDAAGISISVPRQDISVRTDGL